jgi:hypothetical protein
VLVPAPAPEYLAVPKSLTSVQLVPFQFSVLPVLGGYPPKAKAAVLVTPAPLILLLAVFKSLTSVQLVPFHNSVSAVGVLGGPLYPPKPKAAV